MPDPLWINADVVSGEPEYDANEMREAMALALMWDGRALGARQGVRPGGDQLLTVLVGSTITVKAGLCCLDPGLTSTQGPYWVAIPVDEQHILAAADASNPRKDITLARVYDHDEDLSGMRLARSEYLVGVPGPSPAEPAVPAGAIRISTIDVPQSGGGAPVVTDRRPWTVAAGGVLPVAADADLAAAAAGRYRDRLDTHALERDMGATWRTAAVPRAGVRLRRAAAQSVPSGVQTDISWDTEDEDTDAFASVPSATVTIPLGLAGLYAISYYVEVGNLTTPGRAFGTIQIAAAAAGVSLPHRHIFDAAEDRVTVSVTTPLAAGDSLSCNVFHSQGDPRDVTAWLSCYRVHG